MASVKPRAMARPRPRPRAAVVRRWNGSKMRSRSAARYAGPVVDDVEEDPVAAGSPLDLDRIARRAGGSRVGDEVDDDPLEQAGVGQREGQVVGDFDGERVAGWAGVRIAWATTASSGTGCRSRLRTPACRRLIDSRFSTTAARASVDSSMVASSSARSAAAKSMSGWRRLDTAALIAGQRGAQVVADSGEQGGAEPVDLGQFPGVACLGGQALGLQRAGGGGGELGEDSAVLGQAAPGPTR